MSSTFIFGFFCLTGGRRVTSENHTTRKLTTHAHYDTVIQTPDTLIPADARIWTAAADPILPDDTISFIFAKLYAPQSQPALLDIIMHAPMPGHPSDDAYEDHVPDMPYPYIISTGSVVSAVDKLDDGTSLAYFVGSSEYVRDQSRFSRLYSRFDAKKPRWRNTPSPRQGSAVQIVGTAFGRHPSGALDVNVENITLNIGAPQSNNTVASDTSNASPTKRKRFASSVSTSATTSVNPHVAAVAPEAASSAAGPSTAAAPTADVSPPVVADAAKSKKALGKRKAISDDVDA